MQPRRLYSQAERAAFINQVAQYILLPGGFLACRDCKVALSLYGFAHHFSRIRHHKYLERDIKEALAAWRTLYEPTYPILIQTQADFKTWTPPLPTAAGLPLPLPLLPLQLALHCQLRDPETNLPCTYMHTVKRVIRHHCYSVHA